MTVLGCLILSQNLNERFLILSPPLKGQLNKKKVNFLYISSIQDFRGIFHGNSCLLKCLPPSWCFLGDFFKFSKLISSQNLTKQRSSKNAILTSFWPTITSKDKIILRWVCFGKIFISDEINLLGDHKNSLLGWQNFGPLTKFEDLTVLAIAMASLLSLAS